MFFNPPFFVSMATAAKFVQPIPSFLAYLVPLDENGRHMVQHVLLPVNIHFH
jgi:hypothetical protein